jgi:acyl-coenzyme A synthetase/AMP-(fatty) acid ligase/3-hydroxymyristoyl/3-hydroxydecanoyl-(acyl carrier protein) dehydratase
MIRLHTVLSHPRPDDLTVCRDGARMIDLSEFRVQVGGMAARLREQPAERYALCIDDAFYFAVALFAVLLAGKHVVVPASAVPGYLASLARTYDAVLTDIDINIDYTRPRADIHDSSDTGALYIDADATLCLFTSGTSGVPKAIHKTLRALSDEADRLDREWGALLGDATVLSSVPHHHMFGLMFHVLWPLAAGRPFERVLSVDPAQVRAQLAHCPRAALISTPAHLARWPELAGFLEWAPVPRLIFSAGSVLPSRVASHYADTVGVAPIDIYGSTETGAIAWRRPDLTQAWRPIADIAFRSGEDGALEVRMPAGDSTLAAGSGNAHWHRTDDRASFDADGYFHLAGRLDRVIKLEGTRVSLPEIEDRLLAHPHVAQAALVMLDRGQRKHLGAVIVLTTDGSALLHAQGRVRFARQLRRYLAEFVDPMALPRHWRFRFALPFDARGKLPASNLVAAFDPQGREVMVLAETRAGESLRYDLRVPPTLAHFEGHFPGAPILPGVLQVDWAIRFAAHHFPEVRALASIDRLKFMSPLLPGALPTLSLERDATRHRIAFTYRIEDRPCASGVITYQGAT